MEQIEQKEGLEIVATKDNYWIEVLVEAAQSPHTLEEHIEDMSGEIAFEVARGLIDIKDLRKLVVIANDLDREASQAADEGELGSLGADFVEASARRVAHHVLRGALDLTKNRSKRTSYCAKSASSVKSLN